MSKKIKSVNNAYYYKSSFSHFDVNTSPANVYVHNYKQHFYNTLDKRHLKKDLVGEAKRKYKEFQNGLGKYLQKAETREKQMLVDINANIKNADQFKDKNAFKTFLEDQISGSSNQMNQLFISFRKAFEGVKGINNNEALLKKRIRKLLGVAQEIMTLNKATNNLQSKTKAQLTSLLKKGAAREANGNTKESKGWFRGALYGQGFLSEDVLEGILHELKADLSGKFGVEVTTYGVGQGDIHPDVKNLLKSRSDIILKIGEVPIGIDMKTEVYTVSRDSKPRLDTVIQSFQKNDVAMKMKKDFMKKLSYVMYNNILHKMPGIDWSELKPVIMLGFVVFLIDEVMVEAMENEKVLGGYFVYTADRKLMYFSDFIRHMILLVGDLAKGQINTSVMNVSIANKGRAMGAQQTELYDRKLNIRRNKFGWNGQSKDQARGTGSYKQMFEEIKSTSEQKDVLNKIYQTKLDFKFSYRLVNKK